MEKVIRLKFIIILLFAVSLSLAGCSKDESANNPNQPQINSCEGCHSDYATLKQIAAPDTITGGGGCGGEAPHIERYDRVYLGEGFSDFKATAHGKLGCVKCHNGTDGTDDKKVAHSGNFISHPSKAAEEKCASCHAAEVAGAKTNIHNGFGQMRKVAMRMGHGGAHEFDKLSAEHKKGYEQNCATCHASCGECHVNRPHAGGGGLMAGHKFIKTPDMNNTCITCHKTRGGHAYLGIASGTQPDVHFTKAGYKCINCHDKAELHGDGVKYEHRYKVANAPKCEDCHSNLAAKNEYHSKHINDFNCQVCHSQPYNNCGSCHIAGASARIPSYQDFKIALNPIKDAKNYKLSLVRRTPHAPDSWSVFGVGQMPNFDAFPTWNYTTPHNILRWTATTKVADGASCWANCHIQKEGDTYRNKNLYLFESDLYDFEKQASKSVTVDGKLPASWGL